MKHGQSLGGSDSGPLMGVRKDYLSGGTSEAVSISLLKGMIGSPSTKKLINSALTPRDNENSAIKRK
jgi:hypothetical protein